METAHRCLTLDANCIEAVRMLALSLLAREGKVEGCVARLGELVQLMDRMEPRNHALYSEVAAPFARLVRVCALPTPFWPPFFVYCQTL